MRSGAGRQSENTKMQEKVESKNQDMLTYAVTRCKIKMYDKSGDNDRVCIRIGLTSTRHADG